ncbi:MAG: hypothetical protein ABSD97_08170 [Acidimicrobiales bacterium]|jgi:pantothenate kinase
MAEIPYAHDEPTGDLLCRKSLADDQVAVAADALARWRRSSARVSFVAIDGHGASGKTTLAKSLRAITKASVVHTDDFFVPGSPGQSGRGIGRYYDVGRLRAEALEPLKAGHEAVFRSFDWELGALSAVCTRVEPSDLVIVEGVYSAAPELSDLVDKAIYVDTAERERLDRLQGRVAPEDWDQEWLAAEKEYFARARPIGSFDLVIRGSVTGPPVPRDARVPCEGRRAGNSS